MSSEFQGKFFVTGRNSDGQWWLAECEWMEARPATEDGPAMEAGWSIHWTQDRFDAMVMDPEVAAVHAKRLERESAALRSPENGHLYGICPREVPTDFRRRTEEEARELEAEMEAEERLWEDMFGEYR